MNSSAIACRVLWNQLPELVNDWRWQACGEEGIDPHTPARMDPEAMRSALVRRYMGEADAQVRTRGRATERAPPCSRAPAIQKGTRVLISLWVSLMFGRVPKSHQAVFGYPPEH